MDISLKDIDTCIALQPEAVRAGLEELRHIIKEVAPDAEELISYQMPAFRYHGMLVGFAAAKKHYGLYPWNGTTVEEFKEELKNHGHSKAAIRFDINKPLPVMLIKKIVRARVTQNLEKSNC